jgi:competence protein ComEC
VGISIAQGNAAAGSVVVATGEITRSARGLSVAHGSVRTVRGPSLLRRWRTAAGHSIERTFRDDAPLVKALLVADWSGLAPDVRDRYAAAGLSHILSISGLHIAIIAAALELTLELIGISKRRAGVATIAVSVFYVALIGAPLPAVRTVLMSSTILFGRLAQRNIAKWAIIAVGAAHPIIEPTVVLDAGFQLSVIGVAALLAAGETGKRLRLRELKWHLGTLAQALLSTTVATIASAPIVAWIFGRISVVGPLTNLAAGPIVALAQPMIFLGMILAPVGPVGRFIADASHPLLTALDRVAATGAAIPGATIGVNPTVTVAALSGVMCGAIIVACASRHWITPAIVATAAASAIVWSPFAQRSTGQLELHMIDVGQGDAIALRTPAGRWVLIDAGGAWRGGDAGKSIVVPYIGRRGGNVESFILSHPHTDHVGGAATVLHALHPASYIDPGFPGAAEPYRKSLDVARIDRVRWGRAHPGDDFEVDGVSLRILAPDSAWTAALDDPNLASTVVLARYGEVRILLMGDAERPEEEWLLSHARNDLHADILKVGHHGSRTSSTEAFLTAVRPRAALVSVAARNSYHLPSPEIMQRLEAYGAQVLRTDRLGTIIARTDGARIWINAAGDEWELSRASPPP